MDVGLVNPFLAAMVNILEKVGSITAEVQKPFLKTNPAGQGIISGVVTIRGKSPGTAAITFSEKCILFIVSTMFGETIEEINDEVRDAVGEITNMISGLATQLYEKDGLDLKVKLDQVLMGDGHKIPHPAQGPVLGIPVQTDKGKIVVELCFKET
jgi:chemotaxis protein CheX